MTLSEEIRQRLIQKGASVVGFADLSAVTDKDRMGYKYGISIGIALNPGIISRIENGPTIEYYQETERLNDDLDEIGRYAAELLSEKGFKAVAKSRDTIYEDEEYRTELPHKTVATRAGIGWIGKSAMLVTEKYGSALRITSVLTNAELEVGVSVDKSRCGDCSICKDICPGSAVSGSIWNVNKDRDEFYNAYDCRKTARKRAAKIGVTETLCGLCILKCPWTQKYLKNSGVIINE